MLCTTVSALAALWMALKYLRAMQIETTELKRYWLKTFHLALCYRGFATSRSVSDSIRCGQAAFYCCAYDVITDWRNFDPSLRLWYENVLTRSVSPKIARLALDLYQDDYRNQLKWDGLSRGAVALEFITRLIGNFGELGGRVDLERLGVLFQIVDDVLDIEDDVCENATNCLRSASRNQYLRTLADFDFRSLSSVLPHANILLLVADRAQHRARQFLEPGALEELYCIPSRPSDEIYQEEPRRIAEEISV